MLRNNTLWKIYVASNNRMYVGMYINQQDAQNSCD